jgi:phytoene dehydrogenase-like protein
VPDAVVIGAGPNGLVAANMLASAGWDVLVLEAQPAAGGAVGTAELTGEPGFRHDWCSAFYPFAVASPAMQAMELERYGVKWRRSPLVVAHPTLDGTCVSLSQDIDETAASFDAFARGDGDAWREVYARWQKIRDPLIDALFGSPFPPLRAGFRLAAALNRELPRFARFGLLPVRRFAEEEFHGDGATRMLAGNALHADLTPEMPAGAVFGWLLCCVGQEQGWPVPEGGAGEIAAALVRRLEAHGGKLTTNARVAEVLVRGGRAVGVRTEDGREIDARRAVIATVPAPRLLLEMVPREALPGTVLRDLHRRFQHDSATVKVDWALDGPIPWSHPDARRAGTLHIAEGIDALTVHAGELSRHLIPSRPFLLFGQYSMLDETRAPAGAETAWAYTHTPQQPHGDAGPDGLTGSWDERETELFVERIEMQIEELAPGFKSLIRKRHVLTPRTFPLHDENLVNGALNGGTAQLHQQLVFRPYTGSGRPETPIKALYLGGASAHPGGGVHGSPGANAARAALKPWRRRRSF